MARLPAGRICRYKLDNGSDTASGPDSSRKGVLAVHVASCIRPQMWSARRLFSYGCVELVIFAPVTHCAIICQSGSSFDSNCRPPEWTKLMSPPAIGDSG